MTGEQKHETDAIHYLVHKLEPGVAWPSYPNFELVAMYTLAYRTFEDSVRPLNRQAGRLLRIQVQLNF